MDILTAAKILGLKPWIQDRVVAWVKCPWCKGRCSLALAYNRFICHDCGEAGNAEQLLRFSP